MKRKLRFLFNLFSFLKVAAICLASLYILFWLWRFLKFPFTDFLYPIFDFPLIPIKSVIDTVRIYNNSVLEMGYFIMSIVLFVFTFLFQTLEDMVVEMDRKYDLKVIRETKKIEAQVNKELEKEYLENIYKYKYYSILITYKTEYINEIIAHNNSCTKESALDNAINSTIDFLSKNQPGFIIKKIENSLFITGFGFGNFDHAITNILNSIKVARMKNQQFAIRTDFKLVFDAQTDKVNSDSSYEKLIRISNMEYLNRAVVTSDFKTRFEVLEKKSNFMIDVLGFSVTKEGKIDTRDEVFLLRTKSRVV